MMSSLRLAAVAVATVALVLRTANAQTIISMSNLSWTLSSQQYSVSVQGNYPSQAHLDLYAADVIGDPYKGLNDFSLRWVAETNWTYSASIPSNLLSSGSSNSSSNSSSSSSSGTYSNSTSNSTSSSQTWLVFNGLDTFTTISVCNQTVATTDNQFRQYYFDVTKILSNCASPSVSINFGSAPNIADQLANSSLAEKWPYGTQMTYEFPNRWFIRKEQSDFGWDWGPAFAPAGPWLPGYLVQLSSNQVYVRNSMVDIYRQGQVNNIPPNQTEPWIVNASIDAIGTLPKKVNMTITILDMTNTTISSQSASNVTIFNKTTVSGSIMMQDDEIDLWWPNGMGNQTLYYVQINVTSTNSTTAIASVTKTTGFRTIVLNMEPINSTQLSQGIAGGNNWHFEINGYEFYAKGSNLIPPDAFWPRVNETRMMDLFESVVDGNQNMLRVWASGAYLPDFIYDLADEYGILLWSEFEFSDSLYPDAKSFLANVADEANYQVRRCNHHPSLALWAGGNELENLELYIANLSDPKNYAKWQSQYEQLFLNVLLPAVYANSRSISYIPSSTTNGYLKLNHSAAHPMIERYNNLTAGDYYGDTDHYDYDSSVAFDLSSYPVGRFANEFGFQSMPSLQSWEEVLQPDELSFNSTVIELRNHHYPAGGLNESNFANSTKGMGEMTIAVERYYPIPNKTDSIANFTTWILATQIFQADFYRSQIAFYRRGSGFPNRQLGSLYWQLEDIWQAPTWAGIEYSGRWKVLHYVAKDIYQNVIVAPYWNYSTGDLTAYVTSDLWSAATGTVDFTWYDWTGNQLSDNDTNTPASEDFTVGALNTTLVLSLNTQLLHNSVNFSNAVLRMNMTAQGSLPNNDTNTTFTHESWFVPMLSLANVSLQDPGLQLSTNNDSTDPTFNVTATTGVSAWTWLDFPAGVTGNFEDNGFWLAVNETKSVAFTVKNDTTNGAWISNVTVSSIYNFTTSD